VSIGGYYQSCECPVSSVSLPIVTYAANGSSEPKVPDTVGCAKVGFDHSARSGGPGLGSRPIILVAALRTANQFLFTTFEALLSSYGIKEPSFRAIICEKRNPAFACSALKASRSYSFC